MPFWKGQKDYSGICQDIIYILFGTSSDILIEKCSIVLFVSAPERVNNKEYFYVNNVVEMPLEGEIAYEYIDESDDESEE